MAEHDDAPVPDADQAEVAVRRDDDAGRYRLLVDGTEAGFSEFHESGRRTVVTHTVVDDAYEGRGFGSALARGVLDDIRDRGRRVVPVCPFVAAYVRRHPEYADVVDPSGTHEGPPE